jgi:hypothetical protein
MPKIQADYSKTIIYKICCKDPSITDVYIGHTTNFIQRKNHHKTSCINENCKNHNTYVYKFIRDHGGWDNWSMVEIEEHNCKDKRQAESVEQYWIEKTAASLNCINPFTLNKEDPQLYKQNWYEEKKDYILEKTKKHYEENKEDKIEYQKEYAQEHKEAITEYQKENKEKISEQKKIYREAHKEEAKLQQKQWREANKEKLKAEKSQIIDCECGHSYTFGNKNRHLQTKVHISYYENLNNPQQQVSEEEVMQQNNEKMCKTREQQKIYRESHKEEIKKYKKEYYETHKEEVSEKYKIYKEQHKEEIKIQQQKYTEENKEKIKEKKNEWYQKNKEKILERQKEMITCECGSEFRKSSKREHNNSKKHQDYLQTLIEK